MSGAGPAVDGAQIVAKYRQYLYGPSTYYKEPLPLLRGEGKWLWDAEGKEPASRRPST